MPCNACKGQCCSAPAFTPKEFETVKAKYGVPPGTQVIETENIAGTLEGKCVTPIKSDGFCTYLKDGKCSVYDLRPKVCRLYGNIKAMPCQYLYPEEAKKQARIMLKRVVEKDLGSSWDEYVEFQKQRGVIL